MTKDHTRRRRKARSREAILDAARALVLEEGIEAVSLRQIAARAHFSPAALYEYFPGKEALLSELSRRTKERLRGVLKEALTGDPARDLEHLGLAYIGWARENPEDYLLAFGRLRSARRGSSEPVDSSSAFAVLAEAIRGALDAGLLRPDPGLGVEALSYGLWAHVHGHAMLQLTHLRGYEAELEALDRFSLRRFLRGLGLPPESEP